MYNSLLSTEDNNDTHTWQHIPSLVVYTMERPSLVHSEVQHTLNLFIVSFCYKSFFYYDDSSACSYLDQTWLYMFIVCSVDMEKYSF